jgi:hypothetical protein
VRLLRQLHIGIVDMIAMNLMKLYLILASVGMAGYVISIIMLGKSDNYYLWAIVLVYIISVLSVFIVVRNKRGEQEK